MAFTLPPLPYDYNALEPYIDTQTMQLHHDKHHAAYVNNLNAALEKLGADNPFASLSIDDLVRRLKEVPESVQAAVRNNGGGHSNHSMFWTIMKPNGGGEPTGELAEGINSTFKSFNDFKTAFNNAGVARFGSGWVWLVLGQGGKLQITTTPNQDSPLTDGLFPILGNDVWEHAYYLKYQNRRPEYLAAWWNVLNWDEINKRYARAKASK